MSDEPRDETPADDLSAGRPTAKTPPAKKAPVKRAAAKKAPAKSAEQAPSDPTPAAEQTAGEPTPGHQAGSASAAAARRARRIGGRPAGAVRPDADPQPQRPVAPAAAALSTQKPSTQKPSTQKPSMQKPSMQKQEAAEASSPEDNDHELGAPQPRPAVVTVVPAWLNWAPATVLSAGALVMAVLLVVFSHGVWWGPDPKSVPASSSAPVVREQVLAAAKTCVAAANTYKYTDLDTYETKALACTTGQFTAQLKDTIERLIKVNAPKLKSSQTAQINRGGIEAISPDGSQWTILLFGQLSVTNANSSQPRTDPFAAQVRMDRVNGKWLIAALTTVSSPLS